MVLESTIVCVDNSEFSRNGDFAPSRFACQVDSVNMLCASKVQANPESSVGLLTLAGRSARILITSTRDLGRIFTCMHDVQYDGFSDVVAGIRKAQLALKHRQNSLQRQRIVVFVSSPISTPVETLVRLGKTLKKNSVAVDIVNVGAEPGNAEKIDAFVDAVNSNDNSHALHVEARAGFNLADAVMNSEINLDDSSGGAAAAGAGVGMGAGAGIGTGAGAGTGDFVVPDGEAVDPELEMVLRISMEEERARQAAVRAAEEQEQQQGEGATSEGDAKKSDESTKGEASSSGGGESSTGKYDDDDGDLYGTGENMEVDYADEDAEMLQRAIELSKQEAKHAEEASTSEDKKEEDGDDKKKGSN